MADTLKFGPEWLRTLSDGGNVGTPPPSPAFGKYKLAEHRYGREEMLALFNPDTDPPEDIKTLTPIYVEKGQNPLALIPHSEEEQRILAQSVNSVAVLRMFGRGGPPGMRGGRGMGPERGRGRGRGRGEYIQRGMSYEESGGFGRPPRTEGWEEVGPKRGFSNNRYEEGTAGGPPKREFNRSLSSENWRERGGDQEEEEDGDWRRAGGTKWNSRSNWREPVTRGGFDSRMNGANRGGFDRGRGYQRNRTSESWDDEENLPEWSMPDSEDVEGLGTFDSSGAFVSTKTKDGKPDGIERDKSDSPRETTKNSPRPPSETSKNRNSEKLKETEKERSGPTQKEKVTEVINFPRESDVKKKVDKPQGEKTEDVSRKVVTDDVKVKESKSSNEQTAKKSVKDYKPPSPPKSSANENKNSTKAEGKTKEGKSAKDNDTSGGKGENNVSGEKGKGAKKGKVQSEAEKVALERLQDTAENIVLAAMTAEEEDNKPVSPHPQPPDVQHQSAGVPKDPEMANQWFYRDPQGDTQGPFAAGEMAEWFSAGYFTMNLQVRRGCDEQFSNLGELIKRWGRVPFLPGPAPPPLLNPSTGQVSQDILQQQEQIKAMQAQFLMQQQVLQQQMLMRQLQMQQVIQHLQENENFKSLPVVQQQQLAMQVMLKQSSQAGLMVPQSQPHNLPSRSPPSEAASGSHTPTSTPHPPLQTRPGDSNTEEGSIWGGNQGSQPSVWDLDPKSVISASDLEAQIDKARMEEEQTSLLRLKQEEEERRMKEEFMKQQLEIQKQQAELQRQREEMERQKREIEKQKVLDLQRKEEEARRKLEEEMRRKEEEQRIQEERRKKEEEAKREQEELRRREEIRKQEEKRQRDFERQQEQKRQEAQRRQEEAQRRQEEVQRQQEEAQHRLEEAQRQEDARKQDEERQRIELMQRQELIKQQRQQQEALRRLQQEQMAKIQLPSHAQWGSSPVQVSPQKTSSLLEIQQQEEAQRRLQEEVQRKEAERQALLTLQQQQQQQQKSWSSQIMPTATDMKSLLEIQEEQARQLEKEKQRQSQQQKTNQAKQNLPLGAASAWGGNNVTSVSNWASEGAWGNATRQQTNSNAAGSLGFWDDAIISSKRAAPKSSNQTSSGEFPTLAGTQPKIAPIIQPNMKNKPSKTKREEEAVQRLFQSSVPVDDFTQWCEKTLKRLNTSVDIPTFISFLKEVDSPYEVHDYVRSYLGESKETQDFSKQFLEKRSLSRSKAKQQQQQQDLDSIWGPAPARDFRQTGNQQSDDFQKTKGKKKKNKMLKVDSSILGFTCAADPDRINVGDIETDAMK